MMSCPAGVSTPCPDALSGTSSALFLTLINTLMATQCSLNTKANYVTSCRGDHLKSGDAFDFIIVGGGSAGSVLANRLTENPKWRVLLLEAGVAPSPDSEIPGLFWNLQHTSEDWAYVSEPNANSCFGFAKKRCSYARGKALGGSSTINGMIYVRGNKRDYDKWQQQGIVGWNWGEAQKYFNKSLNDGLNQYLKTTKNTDPLATRNVLKEAAIELGYSIDPTNTNIGYFNHPATIMDGQRFNAAKAYLSPIIKRPNLCIATNARVLKLNYKSPTEVRGVQVNISGTVMNLNANLEVILSAGAINTPQILMLSGIGPKQHLQSLKIPIVNNLDVGGNFQDHVTTSGVYIKFKKSIDQQMDQLTMSYKYFSTRSGPSSSIGLTAFLGFIDTEKSGSTYPNVQIHHILHLIQDPRVTTVANAWLFPQKVVQTLQEINQVNQIILLSGCVLNPKSRGRVSLKSTNPYEKVLIRDGYFSNLNDFKVLLAYVKYVKTLLKTKALSKLGAELINLQIPACKEHPFDSDAYWACNVRAFSTNMFHPTSTCAMGANPSVGVVNARLKVFGMKNLRVIDASVFPYVVSGNTNAPVIMVAEKGADIIKQDYGVNTRPVKA